MKKILILFTIFAVSALSAQNFRDAAAEAKRKLESSLEEYNTVVEEINNQKPGLAAELDIVEEEVLRLRNEATNAARIKASFDVEVNQLEDEREDVINTNNYIASTLLNEYIRRLETTIDASEIPLYQSQIKSAIEAVETDNDDYAMSAVFQEQLNVLNLALDRLENLVGGHSFDGRASFDGTIKEGTFSIVGPVSYFSAPVEGVAGITIGMVNNMADIYPLPDYYEGINLVNTTDSVGAMPIDTTNGEALESITHTVTIAQEIFELGGFVMWPIVILFTLAILIALYKAIELFGVRAAKDKDIDIILDHLEDGNQDAAMAHAKNVGGPVGRMLAAAVENHREDKEVIEEVLYEQIINTQPKLERFLPFIAVTAATAPLLGLLGTVTGMIKTFKLITIVGTGDARNLSSGISEALITTKYGLIVAIPSLIMHALLNRKAKNVIGSMEMAAVGFINGIADLNDKDRSAA